MMDKLIADFSKQLQEALAIGEKATLRAPDREIRNIVVSGLGGSGIGANLVSELVADELQVPFLVNKDYSLPNFVDEHTLVIISSYSGNTEETVQAMGEALEKDAHIVCVSSGGKVIETAKTRDLDYIQIPGGNPPRACLGYSFVQQLFILHKLDFISDQVIKDVRKSIDLLNDEKDSIRKEAKELSEFFNKKLPILYACSSLGSVAVRSRQQINENSKMLCWHHVIPEMNHNELVGWHDKDEHWAVLFLRNKSDYARNQQRIELNKQIIGQYTEHIRELWSKGDSQAERAMYLIHVMDWCSYYLAVLRDHDAVEVNVIDFLKGELAKG